MVYSFSLRWYLNGLLFGFAVLSMCRHAWDLAAQFTLTDLGAGYATGLDKESTITVDWQFVNGSQQAAQLGPTPQLLGTLPDGIWSQALGTQGGQIVGYSSTGAGGGLTHAFRYQNGCLPLPEWRDGGSWHPGQ
jgi:probable HAF family extracellular repeat protein